MCVDDCHPSVPFLPPSSIIASPKVCLCFSFSLDCKLFGQWPAFCLTWGVLCMILIITTIVIIMVTITWPARIYKDADFTDVSYCLATLFSISWNKRDVSLQIWTLNKEVRSVSSLFMFHQHLKMFHLKQAFRFCCCLIYLNVFIVIVFWVFKNIVFGAIDSGGVWLVVFLWWTCFYFCAFIVLLVTLK